MMNLKQEMKERCAYIEQALEQAVPEQKDFPPVIFEAMRYSLLAGGKRLRPMMVLAACEAVGGKKEDALPFACALEMIHTYSLIHDDLPGMDNDDYRRGRLTNHKVFGEGFAILAGDGLLNYAYECILKNALDYGANLEGHILAAREIAQRAGVGGMVAGQSIDLLSEHREPNEATLHYIHMHKTADLLTAPLLAAAYIAGADEKSIAALRTFGACVGLAFQIDDDLLDVMGDAKDLGKQTGMDEQRGKMTWPSLVGVEAAQKKSRELWTQAEEALAVFGDSAWFLREFAEALAKRKK